MSKEGKEEPEVAQFVRWKQFTLYSWDETWGRGTHSRIKPLVWISKTGDWGGGGLVSGTSFWLNTGNFKHGVKWK